MLASAESHRERGVVLLVVLLILLVLTGSSASFIWFMNQQQTRAGRRLRGAAALNAAEAGIYRALAVVESVAPDGTPGLAWRPRDYAEPFRGGNLNGHFTIALADDIDGAIVIDSAGEVGDATRRVRARVYPASAALLAGLYGSGMVRLERRPAGTMIVPYAPVFGDPPWIHIAAGRGIGFGGVDVAINDPRTSFEVDPGPVDTSVSRGGAVSPPSSGLTRILLPRGADLTVGAEQRRVDIQQLRLMGIRVEGEIVRADAWPSSPRVDRRFFQTLAATNVGNAALHETAGKYLGDEKLMRKRDSLYTQEQFAQLRSYLQSGPAAARLSGVIYVLGSVILDEKENIQVEDGTLITEGTLRLRSGASLEVVHSQATRSLPGVFVLDGGVGRPEASGTLVVAPFARLRVHGVVYASRIIDVLENARLDIVGAVLSNDPTISFRNIGATVAIRYDRAVLGTPGLRVRAGDRIVAWVASWQELP